MINPDFAIDARTKTQQLEPNRLEENVDVHVNVRRGFLKGETAKILRRIPRPIANSGFNCDDFSYDLPESLIAQYPAEKREGSRLLVFHQSSGKVEHRYFPEIESFLQTGDCIIVNDSKVVKARLWGHKIKRETREEKGEKKIEFLWLNEDRKGRWRGLLRGRHKLGSEILFGDSTLLATVTSKHPDGTTMLSIDQKIDTASFLEQYAEVALPPYIKREGGHQNDLDLERYQTVYANPLGSVAAPTAGLHFSLGLIEKLKTKGVKFIPITLHVGLGTFQPLREEAITKDHLHSEIYEISEQSAFEINKAVKERRRIFVVGTTTARALESASSEQGLLIPGRGRTELFIKPGYTFKFVKNLLTNFHLPKSSLLVLVATLMGREEVLRIYQVAIQRQYRFYSYGDALLTIN